MVRLISTALAASAALYVAGLRSERHPASWHEHPASSPEKLQERLQAMLMEVRPRTTANTSKASSDAKAPEETLRERVARIREDWQSASATSANVCHQQLGRVMSNLTLACESLQPKADWLLAYLPDSYVLPNKTCAESVSDIFALGNELVETLRVSRDAVASLDVDNTTLRRYQALSFLRSWLVKLTETRHHALLWAGFWDGDPQNRTTKTKLFNFAKATEHATVHPDSFLGQVIEASENLDACYEDFQTSALAANMWSIASMSFVLGMRERAQGTVIALVNKQITGERNLSQSVLSTHEIPTVGLAAWGLGFWSPEMIVVDLMGTCDQTGPALQKRLFARLPSWANSMTNWSPEAFAMRSRLRWRCIDCSGACNLDEALAEHVQELLKAKVEQDRKDRELREVVGPYCQRAGSTEARLPRESLLVLEHLERSLFKHREFGKMMDLEEAKERLVTLVDLPDQTSKAELVNQDLDSPQRQLRLEQLLRQNADPNAPDRLGNTALLCAAAEGHLELIQPLLDSGAQLEVHNRFGHTALISAAQAGALEVVEALVKAGAQLEARNEQGATAFLVAAAAGQVEVVEALLRAGTQLEPRNRIGETALIHAAKAGQLKVVQALVKARAQLEVRNEHGATVRALTFALANGHFDVAKTLQRTT
ncbi:unnamed protein product [Symbiodinium natans]|uniref:Uncharacterized protein n=1 Tax=Symbiodinium natans TaxID=878477 RepID=A0A812RV23_9DINO|nr:unnamed protein product [Symbiodinium natans]